MHNLTFTGHVGQDAVIKTPNAGGDQFVSFTVAHTDKYKNKNGEPIEKTVWYDCVYKSLNVVSHIKKGDQILIAGKPNYSMYKDKNGESQISISVSVKDLTLLGKKTD